MRSGGDPGGEEGGHVYSSGCIVGKLGKKHHRLRICVAETAEEVFLHRQGTAAALLEGD